MSIRLGFEVKTGNPVDIEPVHMGITGITGEVGKTSTLEALAKRSGRTCLVILTKKGEPSHVFQNAHRIPMFFKSRSDWQYVTSLLEATTRQDQRFKEPFIGRVCENTFGDLNKVWDNIKKALRATKDQSFLWGIYYSLDMYFKLVLPELAKLHWTQTLDLRQGEINVMDLEPITHQLDPEKAEALQALFIRATLDEVFDKHPETTMILPEAATFLSSSKQVTPVEAGAERIVRQGRVRKIFFWADTQDVKGIVADIRAEISTWILGRQSGGSAAELKRSLDLLTLPKDKMISPDDIQTLELGHFYLVHGKIVKKVYAQPIWLPGLEAQKVAKGEMSLKDVERFHHGYLADIGSEAPGWEAVKAANEPAILRMARENADGTLQGDTFEKRVTNLLVAQQKRIDDLGDQISNIHRQVTPDDLKSSPASGSIDHQEETWTIRNNQPLEHKMDTSTQHGKVMYALVKELRGGPATIQEISDAMKEYGWSLEPKYVTLVLYQSQKRSEVVLDNDKRWRTPKKVKLIVEEVKQ